jgi:hypothetical protein
MKMESTDTVIPGIGPVAVALPDAMKLSNGDVSLDDAVDDIIRSREDFTLPNVDLLLEAVADTPWDG